MKKLCLYGVSSPERLFALAVSFLSFKKYNIIDFDIYILIDDTNEYSQTYLEKAINSFKELFHNITFSFVSKELTAKSIEDSRNLLLNTRYNFGLIYKYDCIDLLNTYQYVLYVDSDILFRKSIIHLLKEDVSVIGRKHSDKDILRYSQTIKDIFSYSVNVKDMSINAGLILFGPNLINRDKVKNLIKNSVKKLLEKKIVNDEIAIMYVCSKLNIKLENVPGFNVWPIDIKESDAYSIHPVGKRKFWNDELILFMYPEWKEFYIKWLEHGGVESTEDILKYDQLKSKRIFVFSLLCPQFWYKYLFFKFDSVDSIFRCNLNLNSTTLNFNIKNIPSSEFNLTIDMVFDYDKPRFFTVCIKYNPIEKRDILLNQLLSIVKNWSSIAKSKDNKGFSASINIRNDDLSIFICDLQSSLSEIINNN